MGPLPNGRTAWLINGGDLNYLRFVLGAHPPSTGNYHQEFHGFWAPNKEFQHSSHAKPSMVGQAVTRIVCKPHTIQPITAEVHVKGMHITI